MQHKLRVVVIALLLSVATLSAQTAAPTVTTPEQFFGHQIGADYVLPNYTKYTEFVRKLDAESDRMITQSIGKTAEGRDQLMAIITSPENHKNLPKYKDISRRLALAEGLTDDQARALARDGKAVVWIDGGLHATEVLGAQQLTETIYQLVSKNDPETLRFLRDVIILAVHVNPDGMELVSDWYMRHDDRTRRETANLPRLYQKYIGHDNNRDFYMAAQNESININTQLYREWFPQIIYNHHQTGPTGTILFAPPFRDPANYVYHPLIITGLDVVGSAMHNRFVAENKPGATMRRGANYSTWWNGGLRTSPYFHNMIGLLTESIGHPTPMEVAFVPDRQIASADLPFPIAPQKWHFRQSVDYSLTANYAVLDVASRNREIFLYNIYKMGKDSIDKGSKDTWTMYPRRLQAIKDEIAKSQKVDAGDPRMIAGGRAQNTVPIAQYEKLAHKLEWRDPRGYILPANQPDFLTATKFVNALRKVNVAVHRATASFTVAGKSYPAGSYVVKSAQAYRPHVLDMFEPQDHPNDFAYPGGPPRPPYDNAGYTLAMQMGIKFDRILDGFECPCEKITGLAAPAAGTIAGSGTRGLLLGHDANDAFVAINRALKAGATVHWLKTPMTAGGKTYPAGSFYIEAAGQARAVAEQAAKEIGLSFDATGDAPSTGAVRLNTQRVGLWDTYGGSMPSGHTRWLLEQFEFPFNVVFSQEIDAGNLRQKYDVLVFVTGAIPSATGGGGGGGRGGGGGAPANIPAEFQAMLGSVTSERTIPQIRRFLEEGGTVITIGSSTNLAGHLNLPIADYMGERLPNGTERPLPQ